MHRPTRLLPLLLLLPVLAAFAAGCGSDDEPDTASTERVVTLLETEQTTILGQPLTYPNGEAQVSSSLLTLQPGEETGWHHHETPLYAYVLDGEVTVDYGADGTRTYEAGTALLEAIGTSHNGTNTGDVPVRILVVNLGAAGVPNTVADE